MPLGPSWFLPLVAALVISASGCGTPVVGTVVDRRTKEPLADVRFYLCVRQAVGLWEVREELGRTDELGRFAFRVPDYRDVPRLVNDHPTIDLRAVCEIWPLAEPWIQATRNGVEGWRLPLCYFASVVREHGPVKFASASVPR